MSKIKQLKNENTINLVQIIEPLISVKKTKYYDLFLRILKNNKKISEKSYEIRELVSNFSHPDAQYYKDIVKMNDLEMFIFSKLILDIFPHEEIRVFEKFIEYSEENLIENNDINKYKTIKDIDDVIVTIDLKKIEKEFSKQIHKIYEDDTWLLLRPLTYESSKKYGYNTKWCTTMDNHYFQKFTERGILIYVINKSKNQKVAVYRSIEGEHEFSFWDEKDIRIDSIETNLPEYIKEKILFEIKNNTYTNSYLLEKISPLTKEKIKKDLLTQKLSEVRLASLPSAENGIIGEIEIGTWQPTDTIELDQPEPVSIGVVESLNTFSQNYDLSTNHGIPPPRGLHRAVETNNYGSVNGSVLIERYLQNEINQLNSNTPIEYIGMGIPEPEDGQP